MRLIDADALKRHGNRGGLVYWKDIQDAPTIDAVPQEQYDKMCHCNVQLGALIADLKNGERSEEDNNG